MAMLEVNDDGGLHLPPELIGEAKPHTKFELDMLGDVILMRPADKKQPFWQIANQKEWLEVFHQWAEAPRPLVPDISLESLRRENIYE